MILLKIKPECLVKTVRYKSFCISSFKGKRLYVFIKVRMTLQMLSYRCIDFLFILKAASLDCLTFLALEKFVV